MSGPTERNVEIGGLPCRVWEKGEGEPLGFLAGIGGLPKWPPLLERLSADRRVIAPSLPGYPGALGHDQLDTQLDWVLATRDLLCAAGLEGADLIGVSVGGALAAEVAAIWPTMVRRLVLVAPLGLYDPDQPMTDFFAIAPKTLPQLVCADPANYDALVERPEGADEVEWKIQQIRAASAAARLLWPLGDTRLAKRLHRIGNPTLLLWGAEDRIVSPRLAEKFSAAISGATEIQAIPGAGHLADLDAPDAVGDAVLTFLGRA